MKTKNETTHPQVIEVPRLLPRHPSVSEKAYDLLLGVIEVLIITPKRYNQGMPTLCGSALCIIGHMCVSVGLTVESMGGQTNRAQNIAPFIGLTPAQCERIYWSGYWPQKFQSAMDATAELGIARIEHFLTTGE